MTNMSEYDRKQLRLMKARLISFENNKIELSSLIGGLKFLFSALEEVENRWEEMVLNEITALETVNAFEIIKEVDEDENGMSEVEGKRVVSKCISNLKKLSKVK